MLMIAVIEGTFSEAETNHMVISVGGVGYKIFATKEDIDTARKNGTIKIWTHLAVRDDAMDLYGFCEKAGRDFFELLISVSGIGPRSALSILNLAPLSALKRAISKGEPAYLSKVVGIGAKKAEKIIIELRDKLPEEKGGVDWREEADAIEALKSLGFAEREVREALKKIGEGAVSAGDRIKEALKVLKR